MARHSKLESDFEYLDALIGISCHLRDYRLVYNINKYLGLAFEKTEDLPVFSARTETMSEYSCYIYTDPDALLTYFLVANAGRDGMMLSQHKQADFFLLIKGTGGGEIADKLLEQIKNLPNILTVFAIEQKKITNIESFISDDELHELNLKKSLKVNTNEQESIDNLY